MDSVTGASSVEPIIRRDGVRLAATLNLPAAENAPCVVFVHGLGSDRFSARNLVISEHLLDAGIATLLFDLSGHGGSTSDPLHAEDAYVHDMSTAFEWAQKHPRLDGTRVGIAASSIGARSTIDAIRRGLVSPAALVLRAPAVDARGFEGLTLPALVIVGSRDPMLPQIGSAAELSPTVQLEVVEDGDHLFQEPAALQRVVDATVGWFSARFRLPQPAEARSGE